MSDYKFIIKSGYNWFSGNNLDMDVDVMTAVGRQFPEHDVRRNYLGVSDDPRSNL